MLSLRQLLSCLVLLLAGLSQTTALRKHNSIQQYAKAPSAAHSLPAAAVLQKDKAEDEITTAATKTLRGGAGSDQKDAIAGAVIMALIERAVNKVFNAKGINFPSLLGGCFVLLGFMLVADVVSPGLGESIFLALSPGSALLAKWLPVFFVPGLVVLPLAPSVGNGLEIAKVLLVTGLGFVYTLSSVAYTVLFLRASQGKIVKAPEVKKAAPKKKAAAAPAAPPKPYADGTMDMLLKGSILSGIASILATRAGMDFASPLRTTFIFLSTVAAYVWGARLPAAITRTVHPIIISALMSMGIIHLFGYATDSTFIDVLKTYKVGSLDLMKIGAGDILLFLLNPAVVSFAVAMYGKRVLLKDNFLIVVSSILVSSLGGLFGTAAFVKLIKLGGESGLMVRLSVLSRNVTAALAMAVTAILGGDMAIATSVVVLTGIIGATYARRTLDGMGISDPITRGLAVGTAAQGLGVASMVPEPDGFPFAAMGLVLNAVAATIFVSIPAVKEALVKIVTP